MPINAIQFQHGLSLPEFQAVYGCEEPCERAGSINGGRKAANKTAFVAAVQTSEGGRPLYMRMVPVADFTNQEMAQWAQRYLAPGAHVVSDGTNAFAQVRHA